MWLRGRSWPCPAFPGRILSLFSVAWLQKLNVEQGLWFKAAFPVTPQPRCPYQISSLLSSSSLPSPSSSKPIQVPGLLGLSILPASHTACAAPRRHVSSTWLRPRLGGRGSQHTSLLGCFNWTHAILKPTCWRAIDCWKKYLGFARPSHSLYITYRTVDGKNYVDSRRSICLPCTVGFLPRIRNEIKQSLGLPTFSALSFPVLLPQVFLQTSLKDAREVLKFGDRKPDMVHLRRKPYW